jgi:hypothetical protein
MNHGTSGVCVELDTVAGDWTKCEAVVSKVAVVPFGGRGERCVIINLPDLVARDDNWKAIVEETCDRLSGGELAPVFSGSHRDVFDFYLRVFQELCAWGY